MAHVEIYMRFTCPYSRRAHALLEEKGAHMTVYDVEDNPELKQEMVRRANGRTTVPEIFIDGKFIGGCDDLMALDEKGELDVLLKA